VSGPALQRSWQNVPHVTQHDEADITELERFRRDRKDQASAKGVKLSPLLFVMKAVVIALREHPALRSTLSPERDRLLVKDYFHLGIAVDTDQGLVVPVVRDVDRKGVFELAAELQSTAERARHRKLTPDDLAGACFTISSLGGIGGTAFSPIVNAPEGGDPRFVEDPGQAGLAGAVAPRPARRLGGGDDGRALRAAPRVAPLALLRPPRHRRRPGRSVHHAARGDPLGPRCSCSSDGASGGSARETARPCPPGEAGGKAGRADCPAGSLNTRGRPADRRPYVADERFPVLPVRPESRADPSGRPVPRARRGVRSRGRRGPARLRRPDARPGRTPTRRAGPLDLPRGLRAKVAEVAEERLRSDFVVDPVGAGLRRGRGRALPQAELGGLISHRDARVPARGRPGPRCRRGSDLPTRTCADPSSLPVGLAVELRNPQFGTATQLRRLVEQARRACAHDAETTRRAHRQELLETILDQRIYSVYEPIVEVASRTVFGYEALARGPERSTLPLADGALHGRRGARSRVRARLRLSRERTARRDGLPERYEALPEHPADDDPRSELPRRSPDRDPREAAAGALRRGLRDLGAGSRSAASARSARCATTTGASASSSPSTTPARAMRDSRSSSRSSPTTSRSIDRWSPASTRTRRGRTS
jgi:hypothetical protein